MRYIPTLLAALLLSAAAYAADLTDQNIQQWVGAYKAVMEWSKTQDQKALEFMDKDRTPDMANLFSGALKEMQGEKIYGEFSKVLGSSGYKDPMVWAGQGDRIMAATMAVEMEKNNTSSEQARTQMQQAMQAIQNNPSMTPQQKAQMQQMMGMSNQVMDVADKAPKADKDVVKRNEALIKSVFVDARPKN